MIQDSIKSFASIAWDVDEPTYREDPALSYSTLARYEREGKFNALPHLFDKLSTPSLTFGSMVDTLITDSEEAFRNQYTCIEDPGISDTLKEITERVYNLYHEDFDSFDAIPDEYLSQIGKNVGFWAADKWDDVRAKKIREACKSYYSMLVFAEGKKIVTPKEMEDAYDCVNALRTSEFTAPYFGPYEPEGVERLYQLKFKNEYNGVKYRSMADLIVVNHNNMTVRPIDLKTSSHNEWEFPLSFQKYAYHLQARLYWRNIRANMDKDPYFKEFKLLNYKFIVVNRVNKKPLVWEFDQTQKLGAIELIYPSGYTELWRDPYVIGAELQNYLDNPSSLPCGVQASNDIMKWLQKGGFNG